MSQTSHAVSVHRVNTVLARCGFSLSKGDAQRVAEMVSDPSDESLCTAARGLSIPHRGAHGRGQQLTGTPASTPADDARWKAAGGWVAARAAVLLQDPTIIENLAASVIREAVEGTRATVERESTPWDSSTRGCKTNLPHDLSRWGTLGEFLEEPSGETVATFSSGSGFAAQDLADVWQEKCHNEVMSRLDEAAHLGKTEAAPELAQWLSALPEELLKDLAADASEWLECGYEFEFMEKLSAMPFRQTLLTYSPESKERLERDVAQAEGCAAARARAQERLPAALSEITSRFIGQHLAPDGVHEILNAIVSLARDSDGLALVQELLEHSAILDLIGRKARQAFQALARAWLALIEESAIDFANPLVKLFTALDDAWHKDGRAWHVTIAGSCAYSFSADNWAHFLAYALTGRIYPKGGSFGVIVRRFEKLSDPDKVLKDGSVLPIKSIGGIYIHGQEVTLLSAQEAKDASTFDACTGQPLQAEPAVRYVDMAALSAAFATSVLPHI